MTTSTKIQRAFTQRNVVIGCFVLAIAASFTLLARVEVYLVPLGCLLGGVYLSKRNRSYYITFVLWLFFLAPMLRRMVDAELWAGSGTAIIASPILACIGSFAVFRPRLLSMATFGRLKWMVLVVGTYIYAVFVGYMQHAPIAIVQEAVNWAGPLCFGFYLFDQREHAPEMLETFRDQFMLGTVAMGLYGIYQYMFLASWDATWMQQSTLSTIGSPEPYSVRVFSTMNAPQTFADFTLFGILLSTGSTRRLRFAAIPIGLATLLLTNSRSAWVGGAVGLAFLILFFPAKRRMQVILALVGAALLVGIVSQIPEFNEQLNNRFQSFTDLKTDSSVNARMLSQQRAVTMFMDRAFGNGFGGGSEDLGPGPSGGVATVQGVYENDNGVEQFMLTFGWFGSVVFAVGLAGLIITCIGPPKLPQLTAANAALLSLVVQVPTMGLFAAAPAFLLWSIIMITIARKENVSPSGRSFKPMLLGQKQVPAL